MIDIFHIKYHLLENNHYICVHLIESIYYEINELIYPKGNTDSIF